MTFLWWVGDAGKQRLLGAPPIRRKADASVFRKLLVGFRDA
jgi:hypothetical protein